MVTLRFIFASSKLKELEPRIEEEFTALWKAHTYKC